MAAPFGSLPPLQPGYVRVLLVRHGESLGNEQRILDNRVDSKIDALTERGRLQASSLGTALRTSGILQNGSAPRVASSTMNRAIQTADEILKEADVNATRLQPCDALIEIDNGKLDGKAIDDVVEDLKAVSSSWGRGEVDVRVGEIGDSVKTLQDRAIDGMRALLNLNALTPEASVLLVVAHYWVNRTLLALWSQKSLSELGQIPQPNAGVSVVDVHAADVRSAVVHVVGWQPPEQEDSERN
eukprot:TRINITY_DN8106_c0_g1_i1.p1 TRINITY_DN8106_c0_g1~~TRINITY_DN8106_c0_g1_i1.p1  ORF type:complete len:242 (-),score=32.81 TRINITY_DN8106_c0_g1_i1:272-997(-)